jgi:hypothetical protein
LTTSSAVNIGGICYRETLSCLVYNLRFSRLKNRITFRNVIPEIDIWRAANLMLKRYGEKALEESVARGDELAAGGDHNGVAVWRRISVAVAELANTTPSGPLH